MKIGTLGLTQYTRLIEKARGAEAKDILGSMRKLCVAWYIEKNTIEGIGPTELNLGTANDQIPSACRTSHYFVYSYAAGPPFQSITLTATRCTVGGKSPNGNSAGDLTLTPNLSTGVDTWGGGGGY